MIEDLSCIVAVLIGFVIGAGGVALASGMLHERALAIIKSHENVNFKLVDGAAAANANTDFWRLSAEAAVDKAEFWQKCAEATEAKMVEQDAFIERHAIERYVEETDDAAQS